MSELRDPIRLRELSEELPADLIAGLRAYRQEGPRAAQRAQMRAALMAAASPADPAVPTIDASMTPKHASLLKLAKRLGMTAGLCAMMFEAWQMLPPKSGPVIRARSVETMAPAVEPRSQEPEASPETPAPPTEAGAEPAPAATPAPHRTSRRTPHRPVARVVSADPAAELALLKRARRALASSPTRALALTQEHLTAHPHGVFEQERELIAIEALVRGGEARDAARRASAFRASFPGSAHLERLRVLLAP